ncbi:hypothetical protein [Solwaraspora sp. WMMA2101]|uniref:hypothetical protein n=1 Tax=Solwaraspora sp. WMMA2101 TaxID=3404124 RepID=UPI003B92E2E7
MDFWDLTKLLFRRWYIAAPLLLISVAAAGWTRTSVDPDYIATSYVQLIPPTAANTAPDEDAPATPRNPWLELGLGSLSRAAALTVQDQAVLKQLDAAGLSENVAITLDNQQPIMTIQVVGESEEQATETTEEVVRRLEASVVGLQADYGASEDSFITARRLDRGDNIQEANSKVNRAMIAVAGVGVLLSAALTIGIDGLLRRRRPRPADPAGVPAAGSDETIAMPAVGARNLSEPTTAGSSRNGVPVRDDAGQAPPPRVTATAQQVPRPRPADREGAGPGGGTGPGGGVYSSGNAAAIRQEGRGQSGPTSQDAPVAGSGVSGGPVRASGVVDNASLTYRPAENRGTNGSADRRDAAPQPDKPPADPPPTASDDTAVISVVRDDATIILPKTGTGREQWAPPETSDNGSRAR